MLYADVIYKLQLTYIRGPHGSDFQGAVGLTRFYLVLYLYVSTLHSWNRQGFFAAPL